MQTQITTCDNTAVNENNSKSKSNNYDRDFLKILKVLFSFNLRWITLFLYFPNAKTLHKFQFKCLIFSYFVKLDNFQRNFPLKVRLRELIPVKEVFETHLRKLIKTFVNEFQKLPLLV